MKYSYLLLSLTVLASCSCHNNNQQSGPPDKADTSTLAQANPSPGASPSEQTTDTILWVGKAARYTKSQDLIYDGKYDSVTGIFIACNSNVSTKVDNQLISYDDVSNCDTSFRKTAQLILMPKTGAAGTVIPLQVDEAHEVNANAAVHFNNGTQTVTLKPSDAARVHAAATVHMNTYLQRQMVMPMRKQ
jgi:hypothetical protein